MAKKKTSKPPPKMVSWSKRQTALPMGKRVVARLTNEITRLENTAKMIKSWPDDEHKIDELKTQLGNTISWLRNAKATANAIPDSFKPKVVRSSRKLAEGDTVSIGKRYFADYGLEGGEQFRLDAFVGKRLRIVNKELTMVVPRGHVVFTDGG